MPARQPINPIYTLLWGLLGFGLTLIGWKILWIPIESVLGLLPDIPIQVLWRDAGWAIWGWSFAVGVFVLLGFVLEPWGARGRLFRNRYWALLAGFVVLSATYAMPEYWGIGPQGVLVAILQIVCGWVAALSALGIVVGIAGIESNHSWILGGALHSVWSWLMGIRPVYLILAVALWLLIITSYVSWQVFGGIPHVGDSVCQIFVAKTFLHGQLWAQPPPLELQPFFFETFLNDTGKWYSQYLPGFALLMVPMVVIGATWLLNPLLTALTVPIAYGIGKAADNDRLGRYTVLLLAACPFVIFMAGGQMNHPAMLFWGCLAILSFLKLSGNRWRWWAFWAGLALGMGVITRPLTGVVIILPLLLYWFNIVRSGHGIHRSDTSIWLRQLSLMALGAAGPIIFLLIYNTSTTGSPFQVGYNVVWQGHTTLGFGDSSWGPAHTPWLGVLNTLNNLNGLNRYLFEIPIPALIGVLLYVVFRGMTSQSSAPKKPFGGFELFVAIIFTVIGAYFFYFFQDFCYGPRFMYVLVVPLLVIIAAGIRSFITAAEPLGYSRETVRSGVLHVVIVCLVAALAVSIPRQVSIYRDIYWDISRQVLDEVDRRGLEQAIVFIEDFPSTNRHAKLHALGMGVRDAWYWARRINDEDLDAAILELGLDPDMAWTPVENLERFWIALHRHRAAPPSPMEDATGGKFFTPYDSGLIAMDPHWESSSVIYARDLGKYNQVLMDRFPDRSYWRYSWDTFTGAFTLKPTDKL
jgi:hypothetical protein